MAISNKKNPPPTAPKKTTAPVTPDASTEKPPETIPQNPNVTVDLPGEQPLPTGPNVATGNELNTETPTDAAPAVEPGEVPAGVTETPATTPEAISLTPEELQSAEEEARKAFLAKYEEKIKANAAKLALKHRKVAEKAAKREANKGSAMSSATQLNYRSAKPIERPSHLWFTTMLAPFPQKDVTYVDASTPVETQIKVIGLNYLEAYECNGRLYKGDGIVVEFNFVADTKVGAAVIGGRAHHFAVKFAPGDGVLWALVARINKPETVIQNLFSAEDAVTFAPPAPPERKKPGRKNANATPPSEELASSETPELLLNTEEAPGSAETPVETVETPSADK